MNQIRLLVVSDHAVVRKGIQKILNTVQTIQVVGEAKTGQRAISQVKRLQPDIVLIDLVMPQDEGIKATVQIKQAYSNIKVVVLATIDENDRIRSALKVGADGYILKDENEKLLIQSILKIYERDIPPHPSIARAGFRGEPTHNGTSPVDHLTKREKDVLQLVAEGRSNKDIARALGLTERTVKGYISNILGKLHVTNRTEAAVRAAKIGFVQQEM